jgi:hypothetical protein
MFKGEQLSSRDCKIICVRGKRGYKILEKKATIMTLRPELLDELLKEDKNPEDLLVPCEVFSNN